LDVEVAAWFDTADFAEFQRIREETLLSFMDVIQAQGTSLAVPTQLTITPVG
jgi:hypothetical protein